MRAWLFSITSWYVFQILQWLAHVKVVLFIEVVADSFVFWMVDINQLFIRSWRHQHNYCVFTVSNSRYTTLVDQLDMCWHLLISILSVTSDVGFLKSFTFFRIVDTLPAVCGHFLACGLTYLAVFYASADLHC